MREIPMEPVLSPLGRHPISCLPQLTGSSSYLGVWVLKTIPSASSGYVVATPDLGIADQRLPFKYTHIFDG